MVLYIILGLPMQRLSEIQPRDSIALWQSYRSTQSPKLKEELVARYAGLVNVMLRVMQLHTIAPLEEKDLAQIGFIGLNDAIEKFDPTRGIKFETYAKYRIRGTILDEIRRLDFVPRTIRDHVANYVRAEDMLCQERGGEVTRAEVLEHLKSKGIKVDKSWSHAKIFDPISLQTARRACDGEMNATILEDHVQSQENDVLTVLIRDEMREEIVRIMRQLPEPQHTVLELHYYHNVAFQDIAEILGISGGRVSQIHSQAMKLLRVKLQDIIN